MTAQPEDTMALGIVERLHAGCPTYVENMSNNTPGRVSVDQQAADALLAEAADRIVEMAAALEPFAKVADRAAKGEIDLRDLAWPLLGVFDADDFLRARAILAKLGGEHG